MPNLSLSGWYLNDQCKMYKSKQFKLFFSINYLPRVNEVGIHKDMLQPGILGKQIQILQYHLGTLRAQEYLNRWHFIPIKGDTSAKTREIMIKSNYSTKK